MRPRWCNRGFTLVEVIFVVVILSIVTVVGSGFVTTSLKAYRDSDARNLLVQRARLAMEQMSRQLRMAVPNSVRVSSTGNCIEFMPLVAASTYRASVPDVANAAAATNNVATVAFVTGLGAAQHVVIAPFFPDEIYTFASPAARAGVTAIGASPHTAITLNGVHRFIRNSPHRRVFVGDNPLRFCVRGDQLLQDSGYGITGSLLDSPPGGDSALMAMGVAAAGQAFAVFPGSEVRRAGAAISLRFTNGSNTLELQQQVYIRNVP